MRNQEYYERLFEPYPDVVTLDEFRAMLGGIGDSTGRKLMRENRVKHFYIRDTYDTQSMGNRVCIKRPLC